MNKKELVKTLSTRLQVADAEVIRFIDSFESVISHTLSQGGEVSLIGFGKFHRKKQRARIGRHPQTGEAMAIPARYHPAFSPGKTLKDTVKKIV